MPKSLIVKIIKNTLTLQGVGLKATLSAGDEREENLMLKYTFPERFSVLLQIWVA